MSSSMSCVMASDICQRWKDTEEMLLYRWWKASLSTAADGTLKWRMRIKTSEWRKDTEMLLCLRADRTLKRGMRVKAPEWRMNTQEMLLSHRKSVSEENLAF